MTPEQVELMKTAARTLIAHHEAGRIVDQFALEWARALVQRREMVGQREPIDIESVSAKDAGHE